MQCILKNLNLRITLGIRKRTAKGEPIMYDLESKIDQAVFPGLQGGPHENTISAMAVAFKQAQTTEFYDYQVQVLKNAQALANRLMHHGYELATGGTDNHLCLLDLRPLGTDGARVEFVLELMGIACNKNTCPGDKSAMKPGGIQCTLKYQPNAGKLLKDFKAFCLKDEQFKAEVAAKKAQVEKFTDRFEMPGFDNF
ncbi:unnamed protein product [Soboliphyme baturini]|uniref:Glycine hydroxymethyltransferase n=1 Tax=Soboliphyme baturini TaxID=241478 RepID=A0A183J1F3_9BILA|nr:unnamed protein product [Soboliphyme baturini]